MKRLVMLAVLCAFVLGTAVSASAADIKASGAFAIEALWYGNLDFNEDKKANNSQSFNIYERARVKFEFVANENLKAVLYTEYGTGTWGVGDFAVGASTAGTIEVKDAYVDFNWPGTDINIKAGKQVVNLPSAVTGGSFILNEDIAAAVVGGAITDNVSFLAGYARAAQATEVATAVGAAASQDAFIDAYILALPLSFDGIKIDPFAVYANTGRNAGATAGLSNTRAANAGASLKGAYWLGFGLTLDMFDPIVVKADLNYGNVDARAKANDMSGWLFDLSVAYTGLDFMTPEVFFAYTSGEDDDATNGAEIMPIIADDWALGSFFFGGDALLNGSIANRNAARGFWTLGLTLKDISFMEGLTHTVNLLYIKGTNDKAAANLTYGRSLTTKDAIWEIDFNSAYKIYEELTAYVELGWLNADYDNTIWGANSGGDAWKISVGAAYSF